MSINPSNRYGCRESEPTDFVNGLLWILFSLTHKNSLEYEVVASDQKFESSGQIYLGDILPPLFTAWATAILAGEGAIILRIGTEREEDLQAGQQAFLEWWGGNRLGSAQWGFFVSGKAFAEELVKKLDIIVSQVVVASQSPKIEKIPNVNVTGTWVLPQRFAAASTTLNAIDAGCLDSDIEFRIEVGLDIQPGIAAASLTLKVRISSPDFELKNDFANLLKSCAETLLQAPGKTTENARGKHFVEYSATYYLGAPRSRSFAAQINVMKVDDSGLVVTGSLQVKPRPTAVWNARVPFWRLNGDCQSKSVGQELKPPFLELVGNDAWTEIWQLRIARSTPLLFWEPVEQRAVLGANPVTLGVEFRPAGRLLGDIPAGVAVSASVYTNMGVRWVDFGTIPARPAVSERELLERTVVLISRCMAISDRWGAGILHLDWLGHPPDVQANLGYPPLREWLIIGEDIRETDMVEVTAVGQDGHRQPLDFAAVVDGVLRYSTVTNAQETIELRTGVRMTGPTPRIMHRWLVPVMKVPTDREVTSFAVDGGSLAILYDDESLQELQVTRDSVEVVRRTESGTRRFRELQHRHVRGVEAALRTNIGGSSSVAVLHANEIVLGVAEQFEPATLVANNSFFEDTSCATAG